MAKCPRCGKYFGLDGDDRRLCGSCASATDQRYKAQKQFEKDIKDMNRHNRRNAERLAAEGKIPPLQPNDFPAASHSTPPSRWAGVVAVLLILGVVIFFLYRAGVADRAISGIAGLFGNEAASDNAGIEAIRKTDWSEFADIPEAVSDSEIAADQAAIAAFMQSGESYRMSGSIKYGYLSNDGGFQEFQMTVEMSCNSELDVYKFAFGDILLSDDEKLNQYFGGFREGTYYIVDEDGKTYLLSDTEGDKTVTDINDNQSLYHTLMGLRPESVIGFDFFGEESFRAYRLNGGTAYLADDLGEYSVNYNPIEIVLKTYGNMPVYHYFCREDRNLGLQRQFEYNFYYNRIPNDKPTAADWK